MTLQWDDSLKWNQRLNVQKTQWSFESKMLLPTLNLLTGSLWTGVSLFLNLFIYFCLLWSHEFTTLSFKHNTWRMCRAFSYSFKFFCSFWIELLRKSPVSPASVKVATKLWLHHQDNTERFGLTCTLWWLLCRSSGGILCSESTAHLNHVHLHTSNMSCWFQDDCYVLPLRWCGLPVKMSCPSMSQSSLNPPMVTCHTEGMVVKTDWTISVAEIKVNCKF